MWNNQNNSGFDKNEICILKKKVFDNITKLYYTKQFAQISNTSKLRTYAKFKCDYALEKYVGISDISLSWRKLFCAFRTSCHDLEIE